MLFRSPGAPRSARPRPGGPAAASQPRVGVRLTADGEGARRGRGHCSPSPRRGRLGPPPPHCPGPRAPALSRTAAAPARHPPPAGPCGGPPGWRTSRQRKRRPGTTSRTWSRVSAGAGKRGAPRDPCPLLHCWEVSPRGGPGCTRRAGLRGEMRLENEDVERRWPAPGKGQPVRWRPAKVGGSGLLSPNNRGGHHPVRPPHLRGKNCPGAPGMVEGLRMLTGSLWRPGGGSLVLFC